MLYEESFTENADFDSTDSHLSFSKGYNETLQQIIKTQTVHFLAKLQMHYMMQLQMWYTTHLYNKNDNKTRNYWSSN